MAGMPPLLKGDGCNTGALSRPVDTHLLSAYLWHRCLDHFSSRFPHAHGLFLDQR
jgi:hypothetical protein